MKCNKVFYSISGIIKNYSFYIVSAIIIAHLSSIIAFYFLKRQQSLFNIINEIFNKTDSIKK